MTVLIGFLLLHFFFGSAVACFLQARFGIFTRVNPEQMSFNEIFLWLLTAFCLLIGIGCMIFARMRDTDKVTKQSDLCQFLRNLENKYELVQPPQA